MISLTHLEELYYDYLSLNTINMINLVKKIIFFIVKDLICLIVSEKEHL